MSDAPASTAALAPEAQTKGISEMVSEKPRRGRPPLFGLPMQQFFDMAHRSASSRRQRLNLHFAYKAVHALGLCPREGERPADIRLAWIADYEQANKGRKRALRWGVLSELGRAVDRYGADTARTLALKVCDRARMRNGRLTTGEAVDWLHSIRMKVEKKGQPTDHRERLANRLCDAIDSYRAAHPDLDLADAVEALNDVYCIVQERAEADKPPTPPWCKPQPRPTPKAAQAPAPELPLQDAASISQ
jgi:hypothetical protein